MFIVLLQSGIERLNVQQSLVILEAVIYRTPTSRWVIQPSLQEVFNRPPSFQFRTSTCTLNISITAFLIISSDYIPCLFTKILYFLEKLPLIPNLKKTGCLHTGNKKHGVLLPSVHFSPETRDAFWGASSPWRLHLCAVTWAGDSHENTPTPPRRRGWQDNYATTAAAAQSSASRRRGGESTRAPPGPDTGPPGGGRARSAT